MTNRNKSTQEKYEVEDKIADRVKLISVFKQHSNHKIETRESLM